MTFQKQQHGLALLTFVIVIALAFVSYSISNLEIANIKVEQAKDTQLALKKAKQALINFAVLNVDSEPGYYGFLPCPDVSDTAVPSEGGSDGTCGITSYNSIGLFPWTSLETGVLRSNGGDCFWYVVSGDYKASPATKMLNEDSNGAFKVYDYKGAIKYGATAEDRVVAIVFNPNGVIAAQDRDFDTTSKCGLDYSPEEFLEGNGTIDNAEVTTKETSTTPFVVDEFIDSGPDSEKLTVPFNDQLIVITRDELWNEVKKRKDLLENQDSSIKRLTEALALCIAEYGNNSGNRKLPRPAAVDFVGDDYRDNSNYDDTSFTNYLGRYPYIVNNSDAELTSTHAPNEAVTELFDKGFCESITMPVASGGGNINLKPGANSEEYIMWNNWKDHFFYAVSDYYDPDNTGAGSVPNCDGTNCIRINGAEYAGVVFFSGSRTGTQVRNDAKFGDVDTKNNITNYLELVSFSATGTSDHTPTGNDLAFCITDTNPFTVISCN